MKFVDAHIHLSDKEYAGAVEEVLTEARDTGLVALVSNSMDFGTCVESLNLANRYPRTVFAALGVHPWTVKSLKGVELSQVNELISAQRGNRACVAVGEIGLDSKYTEIWDEQLKVFDSMLRSAEQLGLPVIIHTRGTTEQIVELLPSYKLNNVLLHWFSNPLSELAKLVDRGYYISEGPPVLYSSGIRDVVKRFPLTNLLTETDGPVSFFKPPFKGKRTTPAFIPTVVKAFAEIKNVSIEEVAKQMLKNFQVFFDVDLAI